MPIVIIHDIRLGLQVGVLWQGHQLQFLDIEGRVIVHDQRGLNNSNFLVQGQVVYNKGHWQEMHVDIEFPRGQNQRIHTLDKEEA